MKKIKTIGISILVAACAVCLSLAFTACKGGDKNANSYGAGEEGFYYYDGANSARYMLSLQSGTYMITANNETQYSGKYSYDEETGVVSFTGDENFTATVGENALSLDMGDSGYSFKAYKYFDVTYVDENGNTVATESVLNGQSAEAITIERDGYYFIGWYEDSANSSEFAFNTSIAGDTTVYGWYIAINESAADFAVTLDYGDGTTEKLTTLNGAVWTLPASHDGSDILGWWISATNKSGELTYMYQSGDAFTSDTTLFAVYGGLGASVTGAGVTWLSAGADVYVTVYDDEGTVAIARSSTSSSNASYAPTGFSSLPTGTYTVEVASGSTTEQLTYVVNGLERVSMSSADIVVNGDGRVISFAPVENAAWYEITVTDGTRTVTENLGSRTYYNFSGWEMTKEGITFTVTAHADGYVSSVSDAYNYLLVLEKVTLDVQGDDVVWSRSENALEYEVTVVNEFGDTWEYVTSETKLSIKYLDSGTYEISVTPKTSGYYSETSTYHGYAKSAIAAPVITDVGNYSVSWEAVRDAASYVVSVNGVEYPVESGTTLYFSDSSVPTDADSYVIAVKAVAAYGDDSSYSDEVTASVGKFESGLTYGKNTVTWSYDMEAAWFEVSVNGTTTTVTEGNSLEIELSRAGDNEITVTAYDSNGTDMGWSEITVYAYSVTLDGNGLTTEKNVVYVAQGDTLKLGGVSGEILDHADFVGWYTQADFTEGQSDEYEGAGVEVVDGSTFTGSRDTYLYAYYSYEWETVKLVSTMGYLTDENGEQVESLTVQVKYNSSSFTLPSPTPYNAEDSFGGWNTRSSGTGTMYTNGYGESNGTAFAGELTLYAYFLAVLNFERTTYGAETVYAVTPGSQFDEAIATNGGKITIPECYTVGGVNYGIVLNATAFQNCTGLVTIEIPDTVRYIAIANDGYRSGTGAFAGCSSLSAVNIYPTEGVTEPTYFSADGVLFRKISTGSDDVEIIYYPYAKTIAADTEKGVEEGEYVLPSVVYDESETDWNGEPIAHFVTTIPARVFRDRKITKITIPTTVTTVASYAFYDTEDLTTVVFEAGGTEELTLGSAAFYSCEGITSITLPARYTEFSGAAFSGCTNLTEISVEESQNPNYIAENGVVYSADGTTIIYCALGKGGAVDISQLASSKNASVLTIGEGAFSGNTKITSVTISSTVTTISESAFENCSKMATLTFAAATQASSALTIKSRAFYGCVLLTEVELPKNLKTLEANAFGGCVNLTKVEYDAPTNATTESLSGLKSGAFGTSYVQELVLGANVPDIDFIGIFGGNNLVKVTIDPQNPNFTSDDYGVVYSTADEVTGEVTIRYYPLGRVGDYTVPDAVKKLEASIFSGKTGLTGITIGAGVTVIEDGCFSGCTYLEWIKVDENNLYFASDENGILYKKLYSEDAAAENPTTEELTDYAESFESIGLELVVYPNAGPTEVVISGDIIRVSMEAFYDNDNIVSVEFNTSAESFEFASTWPRSVTEHWPSTSSEQYTTTSLVGESNTFYDCDSLTTVVLPDCMTAIPASAFYSCGALHDINIPTSCTVIGAYAFASCSSLWGDLTMQEDAENPEPYITLPTGLKTIENYAFYSCSKIAVTIPYTVRTIGAEAFRGAWANNGNPSSGSPLPGLTNVPITFEETPEGETDVPLTIGGHAFYMDTFAQGDLVIPARVTSLGTYAFNSVGSNSNQGKSTVGQDTVYGTIRIEEGSQLDEIGEKVFGSMSQMNAIEISATVKEIDKDAFSGCSNVTSIKFIGTGTNGLKIDDGAFTTGTLTEVVFSDNVTYIGSSNFNSKTSLAEINIPDSVTEIAASAFASSGIETLTFGGEKESEPAATAEEGTGSGTAKLKIGNSAFSSTKITTVELPARLSSLGTSVFSSCTSLETVTFESGYSIAALPDSTFSGCSALKNITLPTFTTSIGTSAFNGCSSLEEIGIPSGVTVINGSVFSGCSSLKAVTLPDGVTSLGSSAFSGCSSLESFTIPSVITEIASSLFANCSSLTEMTIPAAVKKIDASAFSGCTLLKTVTFESPSSLEAVGKSAFANCTSLDSFVFPESKAEEIELGEGIFAGCTCEVTLSSNVKDLGTALNEAKLSKIYVASGNTNYEMGADGTILYSTDGKTIAFVCGEVATTNGTVTVADGIETIAGSAFNGHGEIEKVVFPASVTVIDSDAFYGCTNLKEIEFSSSVAKLTVGSYAFYGCTSLGTVSLPEGTISVGTYAFAGCTSLTEVYLSSGLEKVGDRAFDGCTALRTVTFASNGNYDKLTIGGYAFNGCSQLRQVDFGTGGSHEEMSLGTYAFYGCDELRTITLPAGVSSVGTYAFYQCASLETVIFESSATVELSIGNYAFRYCYALAEVNLPANISSLGQYVFGNCEALESVNFASGTTLSGSMSIGAYAFYYCSSLSTISLPDTVTSIPNYCFQYADLSKGIALEGVTSVGTNSFQYSSLVSVELPNVKSLGNYSFSTITTLRQVTLSSKLSSLGTYVFDGCTALEEVTNLGVVTSVGNYDFQNAQALTSIVIPSTCTTIGQYAFRYCYSLEEVNLPSSLTTINTYAFYQCYALESVELPSSLTSLGADSFAYTTSLKSIIIPGSMGSKLTGQRVFQYSGLETVEIEDGVTYLASYTFQYCENLKTVTGGNGLTSVDASVFSGCTSLESVYTGDSLTGIGASMFNGCTSLKEVTFGPLVTSIGNYAFQNCVSLEEITLPGTLETINSGVFSGCTGLKTIFVPLTVSYVAHGGFTSTTNGGETFDIIINNTYQYVSTYWNEGWDFYYTENVYYYSEEEPTGFNDDCTDYARHYWHYDEDGEIVYWEFSYPTYAADDGSYVVCDRPNGDANIGNILYVCLSVTTTETVTDPDTGEGTEETVTVIEVHSVTESTAGSDGSYSVTLDDGSIYSISLETDAAGNNTATMTLTQAAPSAGGESGNENAGDDDGQC